MSQPCVWELSALRGRFAQQTARRLFYFFYEINRVSVLRVFVVVTGGEEGEEIG